MPDETTPHTDCADAKRYSIRDDQSANWLLRKLGNIAAEKARVREQASAIVRGLDSDAARLLYLYERELQDHVRQQLAEKGGRTKTIRFLQGTCSFRTVPAHLSISEVAEALAFADENGIPCVATVRQLDSSAYIREAERALHTTGELLPGVEQVAERESFAIKFGKTHDAEAPTVPNQEFDSEAGQEGESASGGRQ